MPELQAISSDIQAAIDAGRELATQPFYLNGTPFLIIKEGHKAQELEELRDFPLRIEQKTVHTTAISFIEYYNNFSDANSVIMINDESNEFIAYLDYHQPDQPDWKAHQSRFKLKPTVEWNNWQQNDKKTMSQTDFGNFIETNLEEIITPSGAEMLEIALSIQAKTEVKFSQAQRLDNGQMQFTYHEDINGTAGTKGQLKIPQTFVIGLKLYEGGEPYQIEARLRYRIKEGELSMWYELIRPHKTVQANLDDTESLIIKSISKGKIYHATA